MLNEFEGVKEIAEGSFVDGGGGRESAISSPAEEEGGAEAESAQMSTADAEIVDANRISIEEQRRARALICAAQLFSELSEWIWQFSTVVWLSTLGSSGDESLPSSLFLNSSYQATLQLFVFLFVPRITKFANGGFRGTPFVPFNRSHFASYIILAQCPCILIATMLFGRELNDVSNDTESSRFRFLEEDDGKQQDNFVRIVNLGAICIFGGFAQVLQQSYTVSVERDWIVVISEDNERWLGETNVLLRQIHLMCVIFGPSISGFALEHGSGIVWVGATKIVSLATMYLLLNRTYNMLPRLQEEGGRQSSDTGNESNEGRHEQNATHTKTSSCGFIEDLRVYLSQDMLWAGLGLALLYCDVLTFGGMMVAYLKSCGMNWSVIGIWQGVSNSVGLLGTCTFLISQRRFAVQTSALLGIFWQLVCLTVSISGVLINRGNKLTTARLMIAGVVPSRIGLYTYDLATTQLYQQTVASENRGRVGGTQTGINSLLEFVPLVLGLIYSNVDDYWVVMVVSYISVGTAALMYAVGIYLPYQRLKTYATLEPEVELSEPPSDSGQSRTVV